MARERMISPINPIEQSNKAISTFTPMSTEFPKTGAQNNLKSLEVSSSASFTFKYTDKRDGPLPRCLSLLQKWSVLETCFHQGSLSLTRHLVAYKNDKHTIQLYMKGS